MRIDSAGVRFGTVLATREVGRFVLRESRYAPDLRLPRHDHADPYFSLVVRGSVHERDPRREASYSTGSLHFHPGADPHSGHTEAEGLTCLSVVPKGRLGLLLDARMTAQAAEAPDLAAMATRCHREFGASDAASDLALEALCLELVAASLRARPDSRRSEAPCWLSEARDFLHAHLDRRVTVSELAAVAAVHPAHLARVFRRHLGCSPGAYLRRLRVERARRALEATREPIAAIALSAGFASQAHFTRTFHRLVGMPPGAYRRSARRG
jgi:AraC family transcriptional regulator